MTFDVEQLAAKNKLITNAQTKSLSNQLKDLVLFWFLVYGFGFFRFVIVRLTLSLVVYLALCLKPHLDTVTYVCSILSVRNDTRSKPSLH